jgi:hypothetical protein
MEVSNSRHTERLVSLRQHPINRIAANGNIELNHRYLELWAEGLATAAALEAVVEIFR